MSQIYKHSFQEVSVYGHVVNLIDKHGNHKGLHLDIACGYSAIAQPVTDMGLQYVGFDIDAESVDHLKSRGFEGYLLDLLDPAAAIEAISKIVKGRYVASISIIDALEHITNGEYLLSELWRVFSRFNPLLVLSVPNVAHRDISAKLLVGRWDYTEAGLLDHTHHVHHTDRHLNLMAERAGWRLVGEDDFHLSKSDQYFPRNHPILSRTSAVGAFLQDIRSHADKFSDVNQLVRAYCASSEQKDVQLLLNQYEDTSPFLSIVTRTQGKRIRNLREVLLCLSAQTSLDFEVLLVAHNVNANEWQAISLLIEQLPQLMRRKVRLLKCDVGTRATPLNFGFSHAKGHYVSILDDDDYVFAHWAETFKKLASTSSGMVLRAAASEQAITSITAESEKELRFRTTGAINCSFPMTYDLFAHLKQNFSPVFSLAFPRLAFESLGVRFDETLNSAEDWDFQMQTVLLCGVVSSPEITGIYRKWQSGESSFAVHSAKTWSDDYSKIVEKLDSKSHIFPPGTIQRLIKQQEIVFNESQSLRRLALKRLKHYIELFFVQPGQRFFLHIPMLYPVAKLIYRVLLKFLKRVYRNV